MRTPQKCSGLQIPDAGKPVKQRVRKKAVPGDALHKPGDQTMCEHRNLKLETRNSEPGTSSGSRAMTVLLLKSIISLN
jgi:hypothetical protein